MNSGPLYSSSGLFSAELEIPTICGPELIDFYRDRTRPAADLRRLAVEDV